VFVPQADSCAAAKEAHGSQTLAAALPATSTAAKAAVPAPSDRTLLNLAETAEQALEQRLLGDIVLG